MNAQTQYNGRVGIFGYIFLALFIFIVAAVLYPTFMRTDRGSGPKDHCQNNLKQLAMAMEMYVRDYDGVYPSSAAFGATRWTAESDWRFRSKRGVIPPAGTGRVGTYAELLYRYLRIRSPDIVYCPLDPNGKAPTVDSDISYVMKKAVHQAWWGVGMPKGQRARHETDFENPADQMLLYERRSWHWGGRRFWEVGGLRLDDASISPFPGMTLNMAFVDGHVMAKRLPDPLNGEPDYYNSDAKTGKPMKAQVDPRTYMDVLD